VRRQGLKTLRSQLHQEFLFISNQKKMDRLHFKMGRRVLFSDGSRRSLGEGRLWILLNSVAPHQSKIIPNRRAYLLPCDLLTL
jgi:hypothetical protein